MSVIVVIIQNILLMFKMKIGYTKRTRETKERIKDLMSDSLKRKKVFLNIGNTKSGADKYKRIGYLILNSNKAVENSADKKKMFRLFKENKINSVKFIELTFFGKLKSICYLLIGKDLVLREKGLNVLGISQFINFLKSENYVTLKENKIIEYRVIVFKNKIIRVMIKLAKEKDFSLKWENCRFKEVDKDTLKDKENIIKSVSCLNLDLAGVDVLVNKKGESKIIEVNSGMSLNEKSINLLFKEIEKL